MCQKRNINSRVNFAESQWRKTKCGIFLNSDLFPSTPQQSLSPCQAGSAPQACRWVAFFNKIPTKLWTKERWPPTLSAGPNEDAMQRPTMSQSSAAVCRSCNHLWSSEELMQSPGFRTATEMLTDCVPDSGHHLLKVNMCFFFSFLFYLQTIFMKQDLKHFCKGELQLSIKQTCLYLQGW